MPRKGSPARGTKTAEVVRADLPSHIIQRNKSKRAPPKSLHNVSSENAMRGIMSSTYIYNLSWEDCAVDVRAYKLGADSKICMITTGGDNVLDYLLEDPEYIDTFDMNIHQNFLLEMKIACVSVLDYDTCFAVLAEGDVNAFQDAYPRIRAQLSEPAAEWWDHHTHNFKNLFESGGVKYAIKAGKMLMRIAGFWQFFEQTFVERKGLEGQRELYEKYRPAVHRFCSFLHWIMRNSRWITAYFMGSVGVPTRQLDLYPSQRFFHSLFDYVCTQTDLCFDNYFYMGYIKGRWTHECCPRYLRREHFDVVRSRLSRVRIHTGLLGDEITKTQRTYNRVILLDHMDWLDEEQIVREWDAVLPHTDPGALFCWRSFSADQPFGSLSGLGYDTSSVIGRDVPNEYSDRIAMYNSIHVAIAGEGCEGRPIVLTPPQYEQSLANDLKTLGKMVLHPFLHATHKIFGGGETPKPSAGGEAAKPLNNSAFLDSFYSNQADAYDNYRARMLHGKPHLMWAMPWSKVKSVLFFAGGTGDLLEYIAELIPRMERVTLMDLCEPLLDKARERVAKHGWTNVEIVRADATQFVREAQYDAVLCTYSFTMIPDWRAAMRNAVSSAKPGGFFGVADFTILDHRAPVSVRQWTFEQLFWKTLFSFDRVRLNHDHVEYLQELARPLSMRFREGDFPLVPALTCPYYYGVFERGASVPLRQ